MCQSDPIADLLTRLRNASRAGHRYIDVRWSKMSQNIAEVLKEASYVEQILIRGEGSACSMRVYLKYGPRRTPLLRGIDRMSKPGCRRYVGCDKIPNILNGLGSVILSTPQGVISGKSARERHVGGELLCCVW